MVLGLILLIKGADLFVASSVRIAEMLRIPRIIIGSTLVSLATTSPELVVSIIAGIEKAPDLALGNAIGSCVCNIALILGLTACVREIRVQPRTLRTPLIAMLAAGLLLLAMTLNLGLSRLQALFLLFAGVAYFVFDFTAAAKKRRTSPGAMTDAIAVEKEILSGRPWLQTGFGTALQFVTGALLVVAGSKLLVDSAVSLATMLRIPPMLIGLTIVAIGTSLPELVTAVSSTRQNVSDLAIGNILGANIANLTLIVGSAASMTPLTISSATQLFSIPSMLLVMLVIAWMLLSENRLSRREGVILVTGYACYLVLLAFSNF